MPGAVRLQGQDVGRMQLHSCGIRHSRLKGLSVPGPGHCWAVLPTQLGRRRARGGLGAAGISRGWLRPWAALPGPGLDPDQRQIQAGTEPRTRARSGSVPSPGPGPDPNGDRVLDRTRPTPGQDPD